MMYYVPKTSIGAADSPIHTVLVQIQLGETRMRFEQKTGQNRPETSSETSALK